MDKLNDQHLVLSTIPKEELFQFFQSSIKNAVEEISHGILNDVKKKVSLDEILTLEELCRKFKREAPTVKKAIVALGITPHSYDDKAKPLYLYSEVLNALKNAKPAKWYIRDRTKYLENSKNDEELLSGKSSL